MAEKARLTARLHWIDRSFPPREEYFPRTFQKLEAKTITLQKDIERRRSTLTEFIRRMGRFPATHADQQQMYILAKQGIPVITWGEEGIRYRTRALELAEEKLKSHLERIESLKKLEEFSKSHPRKSEETTEVS